MEAICPVDLRIKEIMDVVKKTGACIVWGGALDLAPADDLFIKVEYPLSIDPLLLPSILSKKKAMGSTHVVIDIPVGKGAKMKTMAETRQLAEDFIVLGSRLGMHIECAVTEGNQPIGKAVGPNLEAREALETLMGRGPPDLVDKATSLAGILFEMMKTRNGKKRALEMLESGAAEHKMRDIIEAQGGNRDIQPEDIHLGDKRYDVLAKRDGRILNIDNRGIALIARTAGAPSSKQAGLKLGAKLGDRVKEGDILYSIYSDSTRRIEQAIEISREIKPLQVGERIGEKMLITQIKGVYRPGEEFILVR
jgi:AMP phosphorylase